MTGPGLARASLIQTYADPGVQDITAGGTPPICANPAVSVCVYGVERFDTQPTADRSGAAPFVNSTLAGGVITASYSGDFGINTADNYGGAGAAGKYIVTFTTAGYRVDLSHTAAIPGVNYFGMWLSALDRGNQLTFWNGSRVVGTYTPDDMIAALGACNGANPYCGNPNNRTLNAGEPYAFVNFFTIGDFFDAITFSENPEVGGYESDNHTFGYRNPNIPFGNAVPEPAGLGVALLGAAALLLPRRSRRAA